MDENLKELREKAENLRIEALEAAFEFVKASGDRGVAAQELPWMPGSAAVLSQDALKEAEEAFGAARRIGDPTMMYLRTIALALMDANDIARLEVISSQMPTARMVNIGELFGGGSLADILARGGDEAEDDADDGPSLSLEDVEELFKRAQG